MEHIVNLGLNSNMGTDDMASLMDTELSPPG